MTSFQFAKVKNLNGTKEMKCKCGTWLDHWKSFSGKTSLPAKCANIACKGTDLVGGHVKKVNSDDNATYIVPICKACNNTKDLEFSVALHNTPLAPASITRTCAK